MLSIRPRTLATLTAILALSFASGCFGHVRTRRAVYVQPGVTASVSTAPVAQGVVVYQAPPARRATVAVRPAAPVSGAVWVQGQWQWNGAQYVWTEGYWLQPRAGSVYVQPRWQRRGRGYVYVQGAWRGTPSSADVSTGSSVGASTASVGTCAAEAVPGSSAEPSPCRCAEPGKARGAFASERTRVTLS
ncbi:MAG: BcpO-related WXXGXW repeat protein [Deltaproteobacteria bacterium]|nr:BcpO-related WXXGXW repeat protein [Deltaproteobacteria bacterium]